MQGRWYPATTSAKSRPSAKPATQSRWGLALTLASGGSVYVEVVRASPPGGEGHGRPEEIVEGEPTAPVEVPPLAARGGKVAVADVELYLRALVVNGGSREIRRVRSFSLGEAAGHLPYGLAVDFHSGATNYMLFVHTLPAGRRPAPDTAYAILEAV